MAHAGARNLSKVLPVLTQPDIQSWQAPLVSDARTAAADGQSYTDEELAALEAQARQRGFEAGRLEGLRAGEAEIKARIDRFEILLDNMVRPFEQVEEKVQQELVLLAGAIAEKLVKHELSLNPDLILETIHEAVGALSANARRVSLRLHPEDIELVNLEGEASTGERHWILIEDPHLSRGECLIESDLEFVDASTTARLNELLKQFLNIDTPTPARWPDGGS